MSPELHEAVLTALVYAHQCGHPLRVLRARSHHGGQKRVVYRLVPPGRPHAGQLCYLVQADGSVVAGPGYPTFTEEK